MSAHDPVESYSVKVAKGQYIDLFLHRSDEPEKGSFIMHAWTFKSRIRSMRYVHDKIEDKSVKVINTYLL